MASGKYQRRSDSNGHITTTTAVYTLNSTKKEPCTLLKEKKTNEKLKQTEISQFGNNRVPYLNVSRVQCAKCTQTSCVHYQIGVISAQLFKSSHHISALNRKQFID